MTIAEIMNQKSNALQEKHEAIAQEILSWFREKLSSEEFKQNIVDRCSRADAVKNRKSEFTVEFWDYHSGCGNSRFSAGDYSWYSPDCKNDGYDSRYYKGVSLFDLQENVCPRLLSMFKNKLEEFGFTINSYDDKTWLNYFCKKVVISW